MTLFGRVAALAKKAGCFLLQGILICIYLLFWAGSCSKDVKGFLACTGLKREDTDETIELRAIDLNNPDEIRIAQSLVRLCSVAGMDWSEIRVAMAEDSRVNAVAIGTNAFVFFEGVTSLEDEQIDAIVAHEVAHAILGHSERSSDYINKIAITTEIIGVIVGADPETRDEVTSWTVSVLFAPYSRKQELAADAKAVSLLHQAGYGDSSPNVMCSTLEAIAKRQGETGGGFLSTHPSNRDRVEALKKLFSKATETR
jgi:Zn-dependent protease with chaperone function